MNQGRNRRASAPRVRRAEPVWQQPKKAERWFDEINDEVNAEHAAASTDEAVPVDSPCSRNVQSSGHSAGKLPEVIATNMAVRLTCTLCAMMGLFAAFMCYAERESRAIRHFAVQSAALTAVHAVLILLLLIVGSVMGGVPYMGFLVQLVCWLAYFAVLLTLAAVRVRMMLHAWRGIRFTLPLLWPKLERYVDVIHAGEID